VVTFCGVAVAMFLSRDGRISLMLMNYYQLDRVLAQRVRRSFQSYNNTTG
jgi:hypothetical protein